MRFTPTAIAGVVVVDLDPSCAMGEDPLRACTVPRISRKPGTDFRPLANQPVAQSEGLAPSEVLHYEAPRPHGGQAGSGHPGTDF